MDYQFNFGHFRPSDDLQSLSRQILGEILDSAPSDSVPIARLIRRRDSYEATIEIFSKSGYFVARAFEKTAEQALDCVKRRIEKRLALWKRGRSFEDEIEIEEELVDRKNTRHEGLRSNLH